jgi:hypothetical protein
LQKDVARIDGRLDDIQGSLLTLRASQAPLKVLKELSMLAPNQLAKALPALQKVTERPITEAAPSPIILREVANKLRVVDQTIPDYWPTVLQFLQFASAATSDKVPPSDARAIVYISKSSARNSRFENRSIVLDGGALPNSQFIRCRIRFTNNPVDIRGCVFIDCAFEFPVTDKPPPDHIQRFGKVMLASDLKSVTAPKT